MSRTVLTTADLTRFRHTLVVHRTPDQLWVARCTTCPAASGPRPLLSEAIHADCFHEQQEAA